MDLTKMFIISLLAGLLVTMNTWVDKVSHIRLLHINDIYMIILMSLLMVFLSAHYDKKILIVLIISILVVFYLLRTQTFVTDKQYLNGMIPHHSMAILMSKKIKEKTKNPRVIKLANQIITSQAKEINTINDILKILKS
jgi:hypothetical protein